MYALICACWLNAQTGSPTGTIRGTITDAETGESIPGVLVSIMGTTIGTYSDDNGKYSLLLPSVVDADSKLQFKFLGYHTEERPMSKNNVVNVALRSESTDLEEVVVVGYGTQKKESLVGSIQTVTPGDLKVPSSQLSTSFAGKLAGVVAVQRSGEPGADGANFWIRGISTFENGVTTPLIIMDGVQISSADLNAIAPEVIESFSVLKDATATALYGSRGANGVMIVTTKTGQNLPKPKINVRFETSVNMPIRTPKTVDGITYMNMYNEASRNNSLQESMLYSQEKINNTAAGYDPLLYPNVDWYDELFKDYTINQQAHFNIRGGNKKITYFMSASLNHDTGMLKNKSKDYFSYNNNVEVWKYNFQNNIAINLSPSTNVALRLTTRLQDRTQPAVDEVSSIFRQVMLSNPVDFPILYPQNDPRNNSSIDYNNILWGGKGGSLGTANANPMALLTNGYQDKFQSTVLANLELSQGLDFVTKGLSFKGIAAFKNWSQSGTKRSANYNQFYISNYTLDANGRMTDYGLDFVKEEVETVLGTEAKANTGDRTLYLEGLINYDRTFDRVHNVAAMFVYNQEQYNINNPTDLITSLAQRKQGIAGRLNYNYDHRYLAEVNFGYNGSENFAKGHRWGFFPSVAVGYNISQESFWEPIRPIVSNLKLRGSWGKVGNDQMDKQRFLYLERLNLNVVGGGYLTGVEQNKLTNGIRYTRFRNENITWEVGEKINVGLDMQFLNSLNVMVDVFTETRSDIFLTRQSIPNFFGTSDIELYGNLGKVRNKGLDVAASYYKQFGKELFVSFKGTFTFATNKILEYDDPEYRQYPNLSRVGQPVHRLQMYQADRLFIDQVEVNNSPTQLLGGYISGGDIKYVDQADVNGIKDGKIDGNDQIWAGHPTVPEIVYGFGPSISWKKWDFSLFFQGAARTSLMMNGFHPFGTNETRNVLDFVADNYWSVDNPNPDAKYPRLSRYDNNNNNVNSTYWLRDAAFLKLKNMEMGYNFKFMRVYLSGTNLFTISDFKLWDPEQGGGAGFKYPTQRVFNLGVQLAL